MGITTKTDHQNDQSKPRRLLTGRCTPESCAEYLKALSNNSMVLQLFNTTITQEIRQSINFCKSFGVEITEENLPGVLYHISLTQASYQLDGRTGLNRDEAIMRIATALFLYYKTQYKRIQSEDAAKGGM